MTALERIKEIERKWENIPTAYEKTQDCLFLLRSFNVMREIAKEAKLNEEYWNIDNAFEERMSKDKSNV